MEKDMRNYNYFLSELYAFRLALSIHDLQFTIHKHFKKRRSKRSFQTAAAGLRLALAGYSLNNNLD